MMVGRRTEIGDHGLGGMDGAAAAQIRCAGLMLLLFSTNSVGSLSGRGASTFSQEVHFDG
jgi:hypothetical protein